tara:strand:- start:4039 stop:5028 length:990 start_codon:yes stop_codon:yes gene_type:complete
MSKLKLPNIVSGDQLDANVWNEHFHHQIKQFKIDSENIAEEGINRNKVPSTIFADSKGFKVQSSSQDFPAPSSSQPDINRDPVIISEEHYVSGSLLNADTIFKDDGTKVVARLSCDITVWDYGARTFFPGEPATAKLGLFYTFDDSPGAKSTWQYCNGTKGLFSLAFTSKIPSDSGGGLFMNTKMIDFGYTGPVGHRNKDNRPDLFTMEPADALGMPTGSESYEVIGNQHMRFTSRYSYSAAFVLNYDEVDRSLFTETTVGGVKQFGSLHFCIGGGYFIPSFLGPEYPGESDSGDVGYDLEHYSRGCGRVIYRPIRIRNIQMSSLTLRK